jgi:serine/threonine-protein kinase
VVKAPGRSGDLVGQRLGKYELLALIAVGGTAEIYLARIGGEAGFEKYLVVKCLLEHLADDQEFVRMFLDEARVGAQLDHSNIVQTLELGKHRERYYMVMEYLAGMSVAQLARKTQERGVCGGLIPTSLVLGLAAQACAGLHYAHERKIEGKQLNLVHRDISPQNLVVTYEGMLKIVDFGIAKSDVREAHTRTGTIKGKFAYMSPEQCLAKGVDRRTDIFALGTLCHELLTGRRLFKRQNTYDTYQAIISGGVPTPSSINPAIPKEIDAVIMKALAYEREDRYPTAQDFGEALLTVLHKQGSSVGPGDVSRFFDEHFGEDLDAHAATMRELIEGQRKIREEGSWDQDFGQGDAPLKPRDPGQETVVPPQLDDFDDDEGPTRIDFEPAQQIAKLHASMNTPPPQGKIDPTGETILRDPTQQPGRQVQPSAAGRGDPSSLGAGPIDPSTMYNREGDSLPRMPTLGGQRPGGKDGSIDSDFESGSSTEAPTRVNGPARPGMPLRGQQTTDDKQPVRLSGQQAMPGGQSQSQEPPAGFSPPPGGFQMPGQMQAAAGAETDPNAPTGPDPMYPALGGAASGGTANQPQHYPGSVGSGPVPQPMPHYGSPQPFPAFHQTQQQRPARTTPLWLYAAVFAVAMGIGLGVTMLLR